MFSMRLVSLGNFQEAGPSVGNLSSPAVRYKHCRNHSRAVKTGGIIHPVRLT